MTSISETKIVGKWQHRIRLYFPCSDFADIAGPHGTAPTVVQFAAVLKEHLEDCEKGCTK